MFGIFSLSLIGVLIWFMLFRDQSCKREQDHTPINILSFGLVEKDWHPFRPFCTGFHFFFLKQKFKSNLAHQYHSFRIVPAEIPGDSKPQRIPWPTTTCTHKMARWIFTTGLLIRRKLETGRLAALSLVYFYICIPLTVTLFRHFHLLTVY